MQIGQKDDGERRELQEANPLGANRGPTGVYKCRDGPEMGALILTLGAEGGQSAWTQGRQGAGASIFPETGSKAVSCRSGSPQDRACVHSATVSQQPPGAPASGQ